MSKIISTKKSSTIFLAIVLVAGTIAAISPSFMIYAQAEVPDFVMDMIESEYSSNNNNDYENEYVPDEREYANSYDDERNNGQYGKPYYNEEPYSHDDDSYYNDDGMYSKYPTKDKKFVCKTGQFEGFFVKSPEVCNLEIAAGPQGPGGPNQILPERLYFVDGDTQTITPEISSVESNAFCDNGDIVIDGQFIISNLAGPLGLDFLRAGTLPNDSFDRYSSAISGTSGTSIQVTAICFDNPPLRP